jgi:hypothetical protein
LLNYSIRNEEGNTKINQKVIQKKDSGIFFKRKIDSI